jgi:hypothetical protein
MQQGQGQDRRRLALPGTSLSEAGSSGRVSLREPPRRSPDLAPAATPARSCRAQGRAVPRVRKSGTTACMAATATARTKTAEPATTIAVRHSCRCGRPCQTCCSPPAGLRGACCAARPSRLPDTALEEEVARFVKDRREILPARVVRRETVSTTPQCRPACRPETAAAGSAGSRRHGEATSRRSRWLRPSTSCAPSENGPASAMGSSASAVLLRDTLVGLEQLRLLVRGVSDRCDGFELLAESLELADREGASLTVPGP